MLAIGGVSISVSTRCHDGQFSYKYFISDLYDFDIRGIPGFTDRTVSGEIKTIGVKWSEVCFGCKWESFYHEGQYESP